MTTAITIDERMVLGLFMDGLLIVWIEGIQGGEVAF
jgi:hypothetical protein